MTLMSNSTCCIIPLVYDFTQLLSSGNYEMCDKDESTPINRFSSFVVVCGTCT